MLDLPAAHTARRPPRSRISGSEGGKASCKPRDGPAEASRRQPWPHTGWVTPVKNMPRHFQADHNCWQRVLSGATRASNKRGGRRPGFRSKFLNGRSGTLRRRRSGQPVLAFHFNVVFPGQNAVFAASELNPLRRRRNVMLVSRGYSEVTHLPRLIDR